jgi:hypothetical protein
MLELTLRGSRAVPRPPPSAVPPRIGQEVTNSHGFVYTWNGRYWAPPEAQLRLVADLIEGPRIMRPSDDRPLTNLPPTTGDLWWDSLGCQLYVWHIDGAGVGQWVVTGNSSGDTAVTTDGASILGDGTTAAPLTVNLVAGVQY